MWTAALRRGSMAEPMDPIAEQLLAALRTLPRSDAIAQALSLCRDGSVRTPEAKCAAAHVLLRSDDAKVVQAAHDLALSAAGKHTDAMPLAARCYDRLRVLAGEAQKFGTCRNADGSMHAVDPRTTDSERAKWGLPPLAVLAERVEQENR